MQILDYIYKHSNVARGIQTRIRNDRKCDT